MGKRGYDIRKVVFLAVMATAIYLGTAVRPALLDDADSTHAVVARAMLHTGDYTVLKINGIRYLMKSPLHFWLVAGSYAVFGVTAFATRFPVAMAMVLMTLLAYEFGRRFESERAGFYGAMAAASGVGFYIFTRIMIPEAIYALLFLAIFYFFLRGWRGTFPARYAYSICAVLTGLAVLTRGLIGVIFPVFVIGIFLACTGGYRRWRELRLIRNGLIFLAVAAPWHILAEMRSPGFLYQYIIVEHFKRAVGTRYPPDYEGTPLWLWLLAHVGWLFPWSLFAPLALRLRPKPATWKSLDMRGEARLLCFIWVAFILLFFSATTGSRMEYYSFGAWPALALLLGMGLAAAEETSSRWTLRVTAALAVAGVAIGAVLVFFVWQSRGVQVNGDISSLLHERNTDFYRLSMAHFLDLTPQAFAALRLPALLAAIAFVVGFPAAYVLRRKQLATGSVVAIAVTMVTFFIAANIAYGTYNPQLSSYALAEHINQHLQPNDDVMICGNFDWSSSIAFYTGRQVLIFDGRYGTNLEPGAKYPDIPPVFVEKNGFNAEWNSGRRVFLSIPHEGHAVCAEALRGQQAYVLDESGGKLLVSNRRDSNSEPEFSQWTEGELRP